MYRWFNDLNNSPEVIRHLKDIIPQWYIAAALTLKLCECCIKDVQIPHATPPLHTCLGLCTMFWCVMDAHNLNWNLPPGKQNTLLTATSASCSVFFRLQRVPKSILGHQYGFCHVILPTPNRLPVFTRPFYPAVSLMAAASSSTPVHSHSDGDF